MNGSKNKIILSNRFRQQVFIVDIESEEREQIKFDENVQKVSQNGEGTKLWVTLKNNMVIEWDCINKVESKRYNVHSNVLTSVINKSGTIMITGGQYLYIWDLQTGQIVTELVGHDSSLVECIREILFSQSETELYTAGFDKTIKIWSLIENNLLYSINLETSRQGLALSPNEEYILTSGWDSYVQEIENPLFRQIVRSTKQENTENTKWELIPLSQSVLTHQEISFYQKLNQRKGNLDLILKYLQKQNQIFFPYKFTPLHIFVANGNAECLEKALQQGYAFTEDCMEKSPLSYAFEYKYLNCVDVIAQHFSDNDSFLPLSNKDFQKMLKCNIPSVIPLFDQVFKVLTKTVTGLLPEFGQFSQTTFKFVDSDMVTNEIAKEFTENTNQESIEPVEFLMTKFKLNLTSGSKSSLKILKGLVESDPEIFRGSVKLIIDYKWQIFEKYFKVQSLIFYLYLILVSLLVIYQDSFLLVNTVRGLTTLFLLYEALQCYANRSYYLFDFWNYFDVSGFLIIFYICFQEKINLETEGEKLLFGFGFFQIFSRGMSYLRAFDVTRYLVGMITEIIKGMSSFFIVLVYSIYALGCINFVMSRKNEEVPLGEYLSNMLTFYRVSMGDWEFENFYSFGLMVIFILSTLLFPLILMNLLIALMGDTYSRVQDKMTAIDYALKAQLIWEIESILLNRRKSGKDQYLIVYQKKEILAGADQQEGQLRQIKVNTQSLIKMMRQLERKIQ